MSFRSQGLRLHINFDGRFNLYDANFARLRHRIYPERIIIPWAGKTGSHVRICSRGPRQPLHRRSPTVRKRSSMALT